MSPELRRVLDVLARYKVALPVGALVELGIVQDRPGPSLSYDQMRAVAARAGLVRWPFSGIVERIVQNRGNPSGFTAWGFYTQPHYLPPKGVYWCEPFDGDRLPAIGNPHLLPRNLLREVPSARPPA